MPLLNYDIVRDEDEVEEERVNDLNAESPSQDAFDQLFNDYQAAPQPPVRPFSSESSQVTGTVLGTSFGSSLTEEQKKRMEYNKLLATERRKAKLAAMQNSFDADNSENEDSTLLLQSSNSEFEDDRNTASESLILNSQPLNEEIRDNSYNNSESLFDNLYKQSAESENSNVNDGLEHENHPTVLDQPKDSEELGLDELMDLVDEQPKDSEERDHDESVELVKKEQLEKFKRNKV